MEKRNKIILGLLLFLTVIIIIICVFSIKSKNEIVVTDAVRFKEEYESLNGAINSSEKVYPSVEISIDNPMVYKTDEEIISILKNETAIIYFGFKTCPWCRNMLEQLLKAAKDNNVSKIYYVNIYDIRDSYELSNDNKVEKVKDGTNYYYEILNFFGKKLDNYYLRDSDNKSYDTKTTRLYAPTVVAVKDGKIESMHVGTVSSQTDPYEKLSAEQKEELYNIFDSLIKSIFSSTCETSDYC